ncbi:MAG: DUF4177 domain-containing protein [Deltaproteobacteria bacterium]|nr:DUF4177 domain-containing protein [Deltaproteobacteria bacterium]MCL5276546.1 DUF4177 domain-containing protein [Deltaproteobacteria bacterium]
MGNPEYKVVEVSMVTDTEIETVLNEWSRRGWELERITYAMRESQKRPSMAFVIFTRKADAGK